MIIEFAVSCHILKMIWLTLKNDIIFVVKHQNFRINTRIVAGHWMNFSASNKAANVFESLISPF